MCMKETTFAPEEELFLTDDVAVRLLYVVKGEISITTS